MIRQTTFIVLALARRRPGESPRGLARDRVREEVRVVADADGRPPEAVADVEQLLVLRVSDVGRERQPRRIVRDDDR